MISKGIATFTLDYGKCPPWLFERMVRLGREMTYIIIDEYGPDEFVRRISDPVWFQSLGTVLAFDWNASGLTTILTAALKEAIRGREQDLGLFIAGGKGKTSKKTPDQIAEYSERVNIDNAVSKNLVYNSKMAAKVDNALLQDGYQIYHHAFFFTKRGVWSVVQQGMNTDTVSARRYHWYSDNIKDIVVEPHSGIASQAFGAALNLSAQKRDKTRDVSVDLVNAGYNSVMKEITILRKHSSRLSSMIALSTRDGKTPGVKNALTPGVEEERKEHQLTLLQLYDVDFDTHPVVHEDFSKSKYLEKVFFNVTEQKPDSYEKLLATKGVGPKTMRALSLVAEVIYGAKPSYEDPARYSFAHGGKDEIPYPVDTETYDQTIEFFKRVINKTRLSFFDKKRLLSKIEKKPS